MDNRVRHGLTGTGAIIGVMGVIILFATMKPLSVVGLIIFMWGNNLIEAYRKKQK